MIHIKEGEEFCLGESVYLFNGKAITFVRKHDGKAKKSKSKAADFTPPKLKEVQDWFLSKGYTKEHAKRAFDHYALGEPPWTDSHGTPVRAWKQKMNTNWCKEEGKIKVQSDESQKIDFFKK